MTAMEAQTTGKQSTYDPQSAPPPFGHALHKYFAFDPAYVNLNHGSYGSLPLPVRHYVDALEDEVEANPDKWCRFTYYPLLTAVREQVAQLLGARADECVIVQNTSVGIATVLRNFDWGDGDVLIGATTTYNSIDRTMDYLHDIHPTLTLSSFSLRFPTTHADILTSFRAHLRSIPRPEPSAANPNPKAVAIIDAIISNPGALLPWEEMVRICREEKVYSVVDAAHAIGQQVGINLSESKPDFWISNCHKWLFAKRSCAVLYVPEWNRHIIKSSFPTSHLYQRKPTVKQWLNQFDWNGTIDFVPYLSVKAALEFRHWLGGEEAINAYCHDLAMKGGARLAEVLGTEVMGNAEEITLNMTNVALPLPPHTREHYAHIDKTLRERLLIQGNCYAAHYYHADRWWTRASAQVWNEISDFEHVGRAFAAVCKDLTKQITSGALKGQAAV